MLKKIFFYSILILLPFLIMEGIFRLLPVSNPPYVLPVSSQSPVAHFQPGVDYIFSKGWNFSIIAHKNSNNFGWNNVADYRPGETTPLLVVIGDSYVEAHAVDAGKSAPELLDSGVRGKGRVYSIGLSGAALSQYLVFADYARTTFRPAAMAFVIVGNDFDESLLKYSSHPAFHYFEENGNEFGMRRVDYQLSTAKKILRQSAFVRYVMLNLSLKETLQRLPRSAAGREEYVGNVRATVEPTRLADSMRAIDEYFRQLPLRTGLDPRSILFVVDGPRPALYSPDALKKAESSYVVRTTRYFKEQALARGYEVVDMAPVFIDKHRSDNVRFEFPIDGHWNELAHRLVAEEIRKTALFARVFQRDVGD